MKVRHLNKSALRYTLRHYRSIRGCGFRSRFIVSASRLVYLVFLLSRDKCVSALFTARENNNIQADTANVRFTYARIFKIFPSF